jgi:Domain of unknown function (DUF4190)
MTHPTPPGDPVRPDPLFATPDPWAPTFGPVSPGNPQPTPPIYPAPPGNPQPAPPIYPAPSGNPQPAPPIYSAVPGPSLPPPTAMLPGFPAYDPYAPARPYASPAYPPSSPYDYGYGMPYGYAGFAQPVRTEGLAIASLVVSCVSVAGLCVWGIASVLGILGAIFGHVARSRIRSSGARGNGMALAGIIVGWTSAAIGLLMVALFITLAVIDGFDI